MWGSQNQRPDKTTWIYSKSLNVTSFWTVKVTVKFQISRFPGYDVTAACCGLKDQALWWPKQSRPLGVRIENNPYMKRSAWMTLQLFWWRHGFYKVCWNVKRERGWAAVFCNYTYRQLKLSVDLGFDNANQKVVGTKWLAKPTMRLLAKPTSEGRGIGLDVARAAVPEVVCKANPLNCLKSTFCF